RRPGHLAPRRRAGRRRRRDRGARRRSPRPQRGLRRLPQCRPPRVRRAPRRARRGTFPQAGCRTLRVVAGRSRSPRPLVRQTLEEVAMLKSLGGAALVCALAATAHASVAPTEGSLTTRAGAEIVDVPLRHTEVHIRVTGIVADVEVAQTFVNPYKNKIDATYLFPLPTGAAIHDLAITTGGHTIAGKLVKRDEAAAKYRLPRQPGPARPAPPRGRAHRLH